MYDVCVHNMQRPTQMTTNNMYSLLVQNTCHLASPKMYICNKYIMVNQ